MEDGIIAIIMVCISICISISISIGAGLYFTLNAKPEIQDLDSTCKTNSSNKYYKWLIDYPDKWFDSDKVNVVDILSKYKYGTTATLNSYSNSSLAASLKGCLAPVEPVK